MTNEWVETTLGNIFSVKHGYAFKGDFFTDIPQKTILVTPGNFQIGGGFQDNKRKYYNGPVPKEYILQPGHIIVTMTDLSKESDTLGYGAVIPTDSNIWLHNQRIGLLEFNGAIQSSPKFIQYLLRSREYRSWVVGSATGTTVKHTSPSRIESFVTKLPPLPVQHRIADILGTLDDKIELNRRMNATLEEMARALFKSWFVDFDPVRAKAAGQPTGLPAHIDALFPDRLVDSALGEIPEGWDLIAIDEVCAINKWSLSKHNDLTTIEYVEISEVSRGNITNIETYSRGEEPSRARRRLQHGDTVLSTVRPDRGSYFLALNPPENRIASTGFAVLTPTKVPWSFLHSALTQPEISDYLGQMADGGAYPAVRPEAIGAIQISLPNKSKILEAFHEMCSPLFAHAEANRIQSRTLTDLRNTLLPKLLSGEVEV